MNENFNKKTDRIKILLFIGVMVLGFAIGLLFFARPDRSDNEKRDLTEFPKFTLSGFLSGEYTAQVSLWFSDTYPLREGMIGANSALQSAYGFRGEQIIGGNRGDDIPDNFVSADGNITFSPTDDGQGEKVSGLYVNGNTAYQLYSFNEQNSKAYVGLINQFSERVKGKAQVYTLIAPLHYQIALSTETAKKYGASDGEQAINYMYSGFQSSTVKTVDALTEMRAHNNEYLYYRTDHHWTARGAYYAYVAFCQSKGIKPTPLSDYERLQFDGFLGTLYAEAKQPSAMKNDPDFVEAFVPIGVNEEEVFDSKGNKIAEYAVVYKGADKYSAGNKYLTFIGGDQPLTKIQNPNIKDGSSIVVVKESYGNAFVPFLVDSYEYVYVIDYRQWSGDLGDFVTEKGIDDVLFLNVVSNTSTSARLKELQGILN